MTRGAKPTLKAIDGGLHRAPPPPETVPASVHSEWIEAAADLQGRGLLTNSCLPILEAYIRAIWITRECQKAIVAEGVLVRARDGQLKPNPAGSMMSKAQIDIARLSGELGISPAARNRKSMQPQGPDPDDEWAGMDL